MGSYSNAEAEQNTMSHKFCKNSHPKKAPSIHSFNQYSFIHSHIHLFKSTKKNKKNTAIQKMQYKHSPPELFLGKGVLKICSNLQENTMLKHDFNKAAKQLY